MEDRALEHVFDDYNWGSTVASENTANTFPTESEIDKKYTESEFTEFKDLMHDDDDERCIPSKRQRTLSILSRLPSELYEHVLQFIGRKPRLTLEIGWEDSNYMIRITVLNKACLKMTCVERGMPDKSEKFNCARKLAMKYMDIERWVFEPARIKIQQPGSAHIPAISLKDFYFSSDTEDYRTAKKERKAKAREWFYYCLASLMNLYNKWDSFPDVGHRLLAHY